MRVGQSRTQNDRSIQPICTSSLKVSTIFIAADRHSIILASIRAAVESSSPLSITLSGLWGACHCLREVMPMDAVDKPFSRNGRFARSMVCQYAKFNITFCLQKIGMSGAVSLFSASRKAGSSALHSFRLAEYCSAQMKRLDNDEGFMLYISLRIQLTILLSLKYATGATIMEWLHPLCHVVRRGCKSSSSVLHGNSWSISSS